MKSLLVLLPLIFLPSCSILMPKHAERQLVRIHRHAFHLELGIKEIQCYYCDILYREEFWKDLGVLK